MTEQMWLPQLQSELDGSRLVIKIANWNRVYITDQILHNWYITGQGLSQTKADATNFAGAGPKGETGPQGVKGDTGTQGPKGDTGATGPSGLANNVQFTGSFTIGQLLTIGSFTKDITVQGILATDKLNVMAMADLPGAVDLIGARPLSANTVRLRLRGVSLLTDNTSYSVAITALR